MAGRVYQGAPGSIKGRSTRSSFLWITDSYSRMKQTIRYVHMLHFDLFNTNYPAFFITGNYAFRERFNIKSSHINSSQIQMKYNTKPTCAADTPLKSNIHGVKFTITSLVSSHRNQCKLVKLWILLQHWATLTPDHSSVPRAISYLLIWWVLRRSYSAKLKVTPQFWPVIFMELVVLILIKVSGGLCN